MWFVYLLECSDRSIYTGVTNNLTRRFAEHKEGKGGHYTRAHKPMRILCFEKFNTRAEALRREMEIKGWRREEKLKLAGRLRI